MRIGFDVSQTGGGRAGCGYFAYSLANALAACGSHEEFLVYPTFGNFFWDHDWQRTTCLPDEPNFQRAVGHSSLHEAQAFWSQRDDGLEEVLGNPDVIHSNNFFCPTGLSRARLVYTLYDLSFLENPEWTTEANRIGCFEGVFQASLNADRILAISQFSKRHFLETFPHYPADRIQVAHLASRFSEVKTASRPATLTHLQQDHFWLCVGTLEPRKNHARLLKAYTRLKRKLGTVMPLVLAGGKGWLADIDTLIDDLGLKDDVVVAGYLDDLDLQWLYQNCFAVLYPTLFEGFGLPVLEAMSQGAAVITSDATSIPEIAGDAALLVNPYREEDLCAAMLQLATNRTLREQLQARAQNQARRFQWKATAQIALRTYEEAIRTPRLREVLVQRGEAKPAARGLRLFAEPARAG